MEFAPAGQFVDEFSVDSSGEGGPFGIALNPEPPFGVNVILAAVDDILNTLDIWQVHS